MKWLTYEEIRKAIADIMEGETEKELVDRCQRLGFEADKDTPLSVDGIAGPKTKAGRYANPCTLLSHPATKVAFLELLKGSREIGGNNMGPFVRVYFRLKKDPSSNAGPFCAGGASYCLAQGFPDDSPPYLLGAIRLGKDVASKGSEKRRLKVNELRVGDLAVWSRTSGGAGAGHVAFYLDTLEEGKLLTIDFNSGSFPSPTRLFISKPNAKRGTDDFLFGARWK